VLMEKQEAGSMACDGTAEQMRDMLRAVAVRTQLRNSGEVRTFTDADVREALRTQPNHQMLWQALRGELPLVKVLSYEADGGEYQFTHLSFQEALVAEAAIMPNANDNVRDALWGSDSVAASRLKGACRNVVRIGGSELGKALFAYRAHWDFAVEGLKDEHVSALAPLLAGEVLGGASLKLGGKAIDVRQLQAESINLRELRLGRPEAVLVSELLASRRVVELDLSENSLDDGAAKILAKAFKYTTTLTSIR
jgi:hypothetical protein